MKKRVNIVAVTGAERQTVVDSIGKTVTEVGGWVDDVNFFSNISISLRSFVPSAQATALGDRLIAVGLKLDPETISELEEVVGTNPADFEFLCSLQVTFFHNEPDLRRHIPSVPG